MRHSLLSIAFFVGASLAAAAQPSSPTADRDPPEPQARPNIVLILADDVAFMDFGAYGGEAATPTIDALAARGALFTNYHTSPLCAPSRAMLLTGLDNHRTGVATIPEVLPPEHEGQPGYSMHLEPGVTTIASRLNAAGYRTYMTGKWHLGHGPGQLPAEQGFDRSFILDASGADNWDDQSYLPYYIEAPWFEDMEPADLPDDFYSSEFLVDKMMEYISADIGAAPVFAYLAFQAVHIPVQAPAAFTANYEGVYDEGWAALRAARWERAQALDLIPDGAPITALPPQMRDWSALAEDERAWYAKAMAVNAGMIEAMDHHIGRLVQYFEDAGELDNTIFIVTSDNGPEPSHPVGDPSLGLWFWLNGYDFDIETLGERGSYVNIGEEWARAAAAPGDLFKFYTSEGGLRAPLVMAGPGISPGRRSDAFTFVTDITPTLLDVAGVSVPPEALNGRSLRPIAEGESERAYGPDEPIGIEVSGNAALFRGDHKIVHHMPPVGDGQWRLFDIKSDPGETRDLAASQPERFQSMLADYDAYAKEFGVLALPAGYDIQAQIRKNTLRVQLAHYGWMLALAALALLLALAILVRFTWRLVRAG